MDNYRSDRSANSFLPGVCQVLTNNFLPQGEATGAIHPDKESSRWPSDTFLGAGEDGCDRAPKFPSENSLYGRYRLKPHPITVRGVKNLVTRSFGTWVPNFVMFDVSVPESERIAVVVSRSWIVLKNLVVAHRNKEERIIDCDVMFVCDNEQIGR